MSGLVESTLGLVGLQKKKRRKTIQGEKFADISPEERLRFSRFRGAEAARDASLLGGGTSQQTLLGGG